MQRTPNVLVRSLAICGLWLILAVALPVAWLGRLIGIPALTVAEWARDRLHDLTDE